METTLQDRLGSCVDELFLAAPRIFNSIKPKRKIEKAEYEAQLNCFIENGFVNNPSSFFSFPKQCPRFTIAGRKPYRDGTFQIISYPSGFETRNPLIKKHFDSFASNRAGYLVRWTHGDAHRKTVLCLHGFMLGDPAPAARMFKVRKLYDMGLDVALFIAPFHWRRAPGSRASRRLCVQPDDVVMTAECIGQTIWDLYSSILILQELGSRETGLIGASLGGYIAALFISLKDSASFAAMMVPAVNFSYPFGPSAVRLPFEVDESLRKKINAVWEFHSPLNFYPRIPKEKILIVASRGDRLCPFEHVMQLTVKWEVPKHYFLHGGHWLVFNNVRGKVWYRFLQEMGFTS
jgi:hypothetical protein